MLGPLGGTGTLGELGILISGRGVLGTGTGVLGIGVGVGSGADGICCGTLRLGITGAGFGNSAGFWLLVLLGLASGGSLLWGNTPP